MLCCYIHKSAWPLFNNSFNKSVGIAYFNSSWNEQNLLKRSLMPDNNTHCKQYGFIYFQPLPTIKGRCWENAARRSFFSRDNMENFIQFCRKLGVHQNLLFESDDLGMKLQYSCTGTQRTELFIHIQNIFFVYRKGFIKLQRLHFCDCSVLR